MNVCVYVCVNVYVCMSTCVCEAVFLVVVPEVTLGHLAVSEGHNSSGHGQTELGGCDAMRNSDLTAKHG